jgi:hypothetical protein
MAVVQPVKNLPVLNGTRRFITVLTTAHQRSLARSTRIQCTTSHPVYLRSILILFPGPAASGLFPSSYQIKISHAFLISAIHPTYHAHLIFDLKILIICGGKYDTNYAALHYAIFSSLLSLHQSEVSVLKHPQTVSFS